MILTWPTLPPPPYYGIIVTLRQSECLTNGGWDGWTTYEPAMPLFDGEAFDSADRHRQFLRSRTPPAGALEPAPLALPRPPGDRRSRWLTRTKGRQ